MHGLVIATVAAAAGIALPAAAGEVQEAISDATKTQAIDAIESYVDEDSRLKEAFLLLDPRTGEPIRLAFDHVHEGVKALEQGYVACVDFKDRASKVYDVDVVVETSPGAAEVVKVFLHKVDGKAIAAK